jgi:coenzyme F420-reducing hydrogenase gamma subunit
VTVDDEVDGCPMSEEVFLNVLTKYLKEFGVV